MQKVGVLLLQRGRSNLPSIVRATEMPQKQIKECLFVLIHHNIVTYAETPEGTKMTVYYKADARSIICRDRFSPYLNSVKERLGEEVCFTPSDCLHKSFIQTENIGRKGVS